MMWNWQVVKFLHKLVFLFLLCCLMLLDNFVFLLGWLITKMNEIMFIMEDVDCNVRQGSIVIN